MVVGVSLTGFSYVAWDDQSIQLHITVKELIPIMIAVIWWLQMAKVHSHGLL